MLIFPKAVNFYLGLDPVDMRKSINGLSMIVADILDQDPACGHVFIFINKTRKKLKLLCWDGNGFVMYYKRLLKGRFRFPMDLGLKEIVLTKSQLDDLLSGLEFKSIFPEFNVGHNQYF